MGKIKFSQFAIGASILSLVFSLGYWRGQESVLILSSGQVVALNSTITAPVNSLITNQKQLTALPSKQRAQPIHTNQSADEPPHSVLAENIDSSSLYAQIGSDASPTELLDYLVQITSSENHDDMQYFSKIMDKIRTAVKNDPNAIQSLLSRYLSAGVNDKDPFYIISILQGADIPNREQIFTHLAQQLAADATPSSQEKLLHLASSTGLQDSNKDISNMIAEIALYGNPSIDNKLYALDLIMPYQLNETQKYTVVSDLKQALSNMDEDHKSYAIEHMMRFSEPSEREQMADEFLSINNELSTRIAVLSSLHSGTLSPSQNLKSKLFSIAQNGADPLSQHAKHALMNVFDISNDEYQTLNEN